MASSISDPPLADSTAKLLDIRQVARLLGCSPRHIQRLADAGRIPRPIHLGALLRWPKSAIEGWVVAGCPSCRASKGGAR
jgi:excisionase family DNA binding protein